LRRTRGTSYVFRIVDVAGRSLSTSLTRARTGIARTRSIERWGRRSRRSPTIRDGGAHLRRSRARTVCRLLGAV